LVSVLIFEAASGATAEVLRDQVTVFAGEAAEPLLSLIELVVVRQAVDQVGFVGALPRAKT
jgi:hypothetical protein